MSTVLLLGPGLLVLGGLGVALLELLIRRANIAGRRERDRGRPARALAAAMHRTTDPAPSARGSGE